MKGSKTDLGKSVVRLVVNLQVVNLQNKIINSYFFIFNCLTGTGTRSVVL